jgi:thiosulfate dehydrogenase
MTRPLRLGALVLAMASLSACGDPEPVVVERTAVEHGRALFEDPALDGSASNRLACATCHAEQASGEGGPILPGAPLAGVTERASYWGGAELTLLGAVNQCRYYFQFADEPWTGEETEARAVYAYLESLGSAEKAPVSFTIGAVVDPGAGDGARGEGLYARACASCHGAAHTGLAPGPKMRDVPSAPVLPEQTLAEHPLDEYTNDERRLVFVEKTRHGTFFGYGGQMPPFSVESLTDRDLADVLAFLGVSGD